MNRRTHIHTFRNVSNSRIFPPIFAGYEIRPRFDSSIVRRMDQQTILRNLYSVNDYKYYSLRDAATLFHAVLPRQGIERYTASKENDFSGGK